MIRPQSIVRYERIYLSSFVLGLVASALNWSNRATVLAANPVLAGRIWVLWATLVAGIAVSLTLWYFTARRPSVVAKWIVAIFAIWGAVIALSSIYAIYRLATMQMGVGPAAIVVLIANILYIVAPILLFRPDAAQWFGHIPSGEEPFA